jgi:phosphoglycerate dehydrogenase-like enzyme
MRIVLCYPVDRHHCQQISAVAPQLEVIDAGQERVAEELPAADVFCGHAKVDVPWAEVVAQGRLQWIQSSAAGLDHCLTLPVIDSDIVVTSASGLFADQVAEQALALLLGLFRGLPTFYRQQQSKVFERRPTEDLHGKTVGIVGFGGNGRRLAETLAPFRVRILATDVFPENKPDHVDQLWPADRFLDLVEQVDVLLLCVPLNDQTRGMVDRRAIERMRAGSVLINVARGPVVVEEALVEALKAGHLAGAGLDVTETEPLPPQSELWELPNVLITPHVGAQSARRIDDTTDLFCRNLRRFLDEQPLWNSVDKQLGFPRPSSVWTWPSGNQ